MDHKFKYRSQNHVPLDWIYYDFERHLEIESNNRIFFSAKFGSGKSYFLHDFFEVYKDNFEVVKLFPINYSTASNKDIFELIKFDILFHLLKFHESEIDKVSISNFIKLQWFLSGKMKINQFGFNLDVLTSIVDLESIKSNYSLWSNAIPVFHKIYKTALEDYNKFCEEIKDNLDLADDYLEKILKGLPEYGGNDPIDLIIKKTIFEIHKKYKKNVVLLIDDLDRLDPDHLFRILNVFGNHFSTSSGNKINYVNENRFGFQKIILVGDIANVQSVFWHKYGFSADFEGYFSKYYSKCIFNFNLKPHIVSKDLSTDVVHVKAPQLINRDFFPKFYNKFDEIDLDTQNVIMELFMIFFHEKQIGIRTIIQKQKSDTIYKEPNGLAKTVYSSLSYKVVDYFCWLFDTKENFLKVLNKCNDFAFNAPLIEGNDHPIGILFQDVVIYLSKRITSSFALTSFSSKGMFVSKLSTDVLNSQDECILNLRIMTLKDKLKIEMIDYRRVNSENYSPTPLLSFKKLMGKFVETYF